MMVHKNKKAGNAHLCANGMIISVPFAWNGITGVPSKVFCLIFT